MPEMFAKKTKTARVRMQATVWDELEKQSGQFDDGRTWANYWITVLDEDMNKVRVYFEEDQMGQAAKLAKGEVLALVVDIWSNNRLMYVGLVDARPAK
jgi:hypothetical protein